MKVMSAFRMVFLAALSAGLAMAALAGGGSEAETTADLEAFRGDLVRLAEDLGGLSGLKSQQTSGLAQMLGTLSQEQVASLKERAPRSANWRALPRVLRSLEEVKAKRAMRLRAKLGGLATKGDPEAERETFRGDLLLFVDSLEAFAPLDPDGELAVKLGGLQQHIDGLPPEHLGQLRRMYYRNAPRWLRMLRAGATGVALPFEAAEIYGGAGEPPSAPPGWPLYKADFDLIPTIPNIDCDIGCPCNFDCDFNCSCTEICGFGSCSEICDPFCLLAEEACELGEDICNAACDAVEGLCDVLDDAISELNSVINEINGFLSDVITFFDDVIDEIVALPTTLGDFFTELGNDLVGLLEDLLDAIAGEIPDASALLGLMGVDFSTQAAAASFFADLVDSLPVISIPCPNVGVEIPLYGTVGTPRAEYVCKRGIDWLSEKLFALIPEDTPSVPLKIAGALLYFPIKYFCMCMEAQSALCFADGQKTHRELAAQQLDVALSTRASQSSLDAFGDSVDALDGSVVDVQTDADDVDTDVAVVASELAVVETQIDDFSSAGADTLEELESFRDLVLRLRIEENMLNPSSEDVVALFNSPTAASGFLERVREIVESSIQMSLDTGQPVYAAATFLARGDALFSEGSFDKAYLEYGKAYRQAVKE